MIRRAEPVDADRIAPLFDLYRQFYGQAPSLPDARTFLTDRLAAGESVILFAENEIGFVRGFVQLYTGFSSVRMARTLILNDLFVAPSERGRGVARALIAAAENYAVEQRISSMSLSTARDNGSAQSLYRSIGWHEDREFFHFTRRLDC